MKNSFDFLQLDGENICAWIKKASTAEESAYYPSSLLFFVKQGTLHFRVADKTLSLAAPAYVLVPKNTLGYFHKTWGEREPYSELYAILLRDDLITAALAEIPEIQSQHNPQLSSITPLIQNDYLISLFDQLPKYYAGEKQVNQASVHRGMVQVIQGCIASDPKLYGFFKDISSPIGVHLKSVIDHHFSLGYSVEELAALTGMSLSTFYREFKKEFALPPHQWLMQRRLQEAYELIKNTEKSITSICYDLGFKDPGHFSRRFKAQFGIPPSGLKKPN
ncbi:MAG: AraC family transcriptional regulator [Bacteroidota bacterium]